jgi:hypothetical protein
MRSGQGPGQPGVLPLQQGGWDVHQAEHVRMCVPTFNECPVGRVQASQVLRWCSPKGLAPYMRTETQHDG